MLPLLAALALVSSDQPAANPPPGSQPPIVEMRLHDTRGVVSVTFQANYAVGTITSVTVRRGRPIDVPTRTVCAASFTPSSTPGTVRLCRLTPGHYTLVVQSNFSGVNTGPGGEEFTVRRVGGRLVAVSP